MNHVLNFFFKTLHQPEKKLIWQKFHVLPFSLSLEFLPSIITMTGHKNMKDEGILLSSCCACCTLEHGSPTWEGGVHREGVGVRVMWTGVLGQETAQPCSPALEMILSCPRHCRVQNCREKWIFFC